MTMIEDSNGISTKKFDSQSKVIVAGGSGESDGDQDFFGFRFAYAHVPIFSHDKLHGSDIR